MRISEGEETLAFQLKAVKIPFEREYRFAPPRKWRLDFWLPEHKIGVEVEGGVFISGGHNRGKGYEKDLEKYNTATSMGIRLLRYSTDMVIDGRAINQIQAVVNE